MEIIHTKKALLNSKKCFFAFNDHSIALLSSKVLFIRIKPLQYSDISFLGEKLSNSEVLFYVAVS